MGNQKNVRKRIPITAKKKAADTELADDSPDSPPLPTRPKPKPTYKGAPKPAHAKASARPSKKVVKCRQSVTTVASDVSMDDEAGEDNEVIEEDINWDEDEEEEEDDSEEEVNDPHQHAARSARAPPVKKDIFMIPFEVSVGGRYKELKIPDNATWEAAQIIVGKKMLRDPETLSLGYINPFKPRGTGKMVPSSLENDEEWRGLIQHVHTFLSREQTKNRGKGGMTKPWTFVIVDMGEKDGQAGQVASKAKGSKNKLEPKHSVSDNADTAETSGPGSDSFTMAEICRRHHCDRCAKACYIDPGPPPTHKPFTVQQLSVWTSLVKLGSASIDEVPDALRLKRRDREPLPPPNPGQAVANAMTTNSTLTASSEPQGYSMTHPGFPQAMHGLAGFPSYPMPYYPGSMPNYNMPAPMYLPPGPYGYPFAPQGTQVMQPNGFPAPFFMQNYHMPNLNYPSMPAPMYAPPGQSGYPFTMPAPQLEGTTGNIDNHSGRKHQFSVSDPHATGSSFPNPNHPPIQVDEAVIPHTEPTINDWLNDTEPDTQEA